MPQMTHAAKDVVLADQAAQILDLLTQVATLEGENNELTIKLRQQIAKTNRAKSGAASSGQGQRSHSVLRFSSPKTCHKPECNFTFSTPQEGAAHAVAGVHNNEFALV